MPDSQFMLDTMVTGCCYFCYIFGGREGGEGGFNFHFILGGFFLSDRFQFHIIFPISSVV